jgi:hypothetical protein
MGVIERLPERDEEEGRGRREEKEGREKRERERVAVEVACRGTEMNLKRKWGQLRESQV